MSELRERLERETQLGAGIGDGWWPFVEAAATLLDAAYPGWKSVQIKEKFAGLRFYIEPAPYPEDGEANNPERREEDRERWKREWYDQQEAIATAAERACAGRCEVCGKDAEVVGNGWIHTLCKSHAAAYEEAKTMRGLK
jgi:hypothetical protein